MSTQAEAKPTEPAKPQQKTTKSSNAMLNFMLILTIVVVSMLHQAIVEGIENLEMKYV